MLFRSIALVAATSVLGFAAPLWAHGTEDHSQMDHPDGVMHVHEAYARVNGTKSGAIFMLLHNNTEVDDRLVGVSSQVAERTELHTHTEENGVMRMIHLKDGIALPWAEIHQFERGGDHVMLMGLTKPLKDGDKFDLTLQFENHPEMVVEVVVDNERKVDPATEGGEMDHSNH